jgi:hypothetical protein
MLARFQKAATTLGAAYSSKTSMVPVVLNTVAAIVLLIVLFSVMGYCVKIDMYKLDVNNGYKRKVKTVINEGYSTATNLHNVVYDTNHPVLDSTNNFKNITASYNLKGGAQYSYRFWIIVHDPSPNQASKTILVRGDPKSYPVFHVDPSGGNKGSEQVVLVKQPLIRFGDTSNDFVMEFNTTASFTESIDLSSSDKEMLDMSKLFTKTWVMLTWVLEDNIPKDGEFDQFENGISATIYINDSMYKKSTFKGALKMNRGPLNLFPDTQPVSGTLIGDITYYNYALKGNEIAKEFRNGVPYIADNVSHNAYAVFKAPPLGTL